MIGEGASAWDANLSGNPSWESTCSYPCPKSPSALASDCCYEDCIQCSSTDVCLACIAGDYFNGSECKLSCGGG